MKRKAAQGILASQRVTTAANEEFAEGLTATVTGLEGDRVEEVGGSRRGWDPYEVWRTRVKTSSKVNQDRERDRLR